MERRLEEIRRCKDNCKIFLRVINETPLFMFTVILTRWTEASSNATEVYDESDEDLEEMNFEEFKRTIRRYRRLIPYMSYYVANNNVNNNQRSVLQAYVNEQTLLPPPIGSAGLQQSIRHPLRNSRPSEPLRKPLDQRSTTLLKPEKFVPSVQYDPKNIGGDTDYFTPVRYNTKMNYNKYYEDYDRRPPYTEITNQNQENRFYIKEIPLAARPQTVPYNPLYERDQSKHITHLHSDYSDYAPRPKPTPAPLDYYPVDNFESVRYVKIEPPLSYRQPVQVHTPVQKRPIYELKNPSVSDENILRSLQLTNQLPEMLNRDNIDSSIKTLVEILSLLHGARKSDSPQKLVEASVVQQNEPSYKQFKQQYTPPKVVTETRYQATPSPHLVAEELVRFRPAAYTNNVKSKTPEYSDYGSGGDKTQNVIQYYTPVVQDIDGEGAVESYAPAKPPKEEEPHQNSYEITEDVDEQDEKQHNPVTTQASPPKHYQLAEGFDEADLTIPTMSTKYGATRGKPDADYPIYSTIPETDFNCKEQRYKGFFGDPSTRCQVWHYCDLNGGKSSFLCPNGTIFSQVALTCDWWFNVKCESTTQLYVLNERLYKFILPIMPKFPEDFSGPEVDRYLELKFEEMEAKLKAKKLKKAMEKKLKDKASNVEE